MVSVASGGHHPNQMAQRIGIIIKACGRMERCKEKVNSSMHVMNLAILTKECL